MWAGDFGTCGGFCVANFCGFVEFPLSPYSVPLRTNSMLYILDLVDNLSSPSCDGG